MKKTKLSKFLAITISIMLIVMSLPMAALSVSATDGTYIVVGVEDLCGSIWNADDTNNQMTDADADGVYEMLYFDVNAGDYQFKVVANGEWIGVNGQNVKFTVTDVCDVTIAYNTATQEITVTGQFVTDTKFVVESMRAVGNGFGTWLNDVNWDPAADENLMTEISEGVYEITYIGVEMNDYYQVKFAANGNWNDNWGGVYAGSGVETDAVYNAQDNITFEVPYEFANVTAKIDISNYDPTTNLGAKFTITVINNPNFKPTQVPTTMEPTEVPTETPTEVPTETPTEAPTETPTENTKVYFEVPTLEDWGTTKNVFCYIYTVYGHKGEPLLQYNFGSKNLRCKKDTTTGLYYYDTSKLGTIEENADYALIFHTVDMNKGTHQTCNVTFGKECLGDTIYLTGSMVERIEDPSILTYKATWKNHSDKYGAMASITSKGKIIGEYFPAHQPKAQIISNAIHAYAKYYSNFYTPTVVQELCTQMGVEPIDVYNTYATDFAEELEKYNSEIASLETVATLLGISSDEPTEPPTTEPPTTVPITLRTCVVAGTDKLCGSNWNPTDTNNAMTDKDSDGIYEITYPKVAPGDYQFKIVVDSTEWIGNGYQNVKFTVKDYSNVTITYNANTQEIAVTGPSVVDIDLEIDSMRVVGNGKNNWLHASNWELSDDSNLMTKIIDGIYTITYKNVERSNEYHVVFSADGSWDDGWGGTYAGSGIESEAVHNSSPDCKNIIFDVPYTLANVTLTIDITEFDCNTKTGAKFIITIEDATPPEPTEAPTTVEPSETPTEEPSETPTTDPVTLESCIVAGFDSLCGSMWDPADTNNAMTDQDGNGIYEITYPEVYADDYQFKVVVNGTDWIGRDGNNVKFTVTDTCDVTITYNAYTQEIAVTGNYVTNTKFESISVVGNGSNAWLNNVGWDPSADENLMTEVSDDVYEIVFAGVENCDKFEFKFTANGNWADNWGGTYSGSGVETDAIYYSQENITFAVPYEIAVITIRFDLTSYDYTTNAGAKFTISIADATPFSPVKIKFAVPESNINRYKWYYPVLYYGNSTSISENTMLSMTKTDEIYYTADTGSSAILKGGGWIIYELTLSAKQVTAVNNAKFVGFTASVGENRTALLSEFNILKAGLDVYGNYSFESLDVKSLENCTFVIRDAASGANSCTSYIGYWVSDYTTVKFAAPISNTKRSTWDKVELYYADNGVAFSDAIKIPMINTYELTKISDIGTMSTLKNGRWYIYAVTLDAVQTATVNNAAKVGFCKPGDENKTSYSKNMLFALTDEYTGTYSTTKRTLEELEGQVFVVQGKATATSLLTFLGEWQSESKYTDGNDDTITINFAAPKGLSDNSNWNTGVELYYGNTTIYRNTFRVPMTKTEKTIPVDVTDTNLTTLKSGDWDIYSTTLTIAQIMDINKSNNVGFIKTDSYNRTSILQTKNINRASNIEGETGYFSSKQSIEAFDGYTFVINDMYDAKNERTSYLGSWIAA